MFCWQIYIYTNNTQIYPTVSVYIKLSKLFLSESVMGIINSYLKSFDKVFLVDIPRTKKLSDSNNWVKNPIECQMV